MYINFQKHILYLKENRVPKATVYCIYNSATIGVIYDDLFFIKKSLDKEKYVCGCGLDLLDTEAEIFLTSPSVPDKSILQLADWISLLCEKAKSTT